MKNDAAQPEAFRVIGSVFRVERVLKLLSKRHVLSETPLSMEEADVLMTLYGAASFGWLAADEQGFVTVAVLKTSLTYNAVGLYRSVRLLEQAGLVEIKKSHKINAKADRRSLVVRITSTGAKAIEPVYRRYLVFCARVLRNVSVEEQRIVLRFNEMLVENARWNL
jgi:DNA-binding MarR family transcriptional regulator